MAPLTFEQVNKSILFKRKRTQILVEKMQRKTLTTGIVQADSVYAADQGSVQGALEASLWQVARSQSTFHLLAGALYVMLTPVFGFSLSNRPSGQPPYYICHLFSTFANIRVKATYQYCNAPRAKVQKTNKRKNHHITECAQNIPPSQKVRLWWSLKKALQALEQVGGVAVQLKNRHRGKNLTPMHFYTKYLLSIQVHALCNTAHVDLAPSARTLQYLSPRTITCTINKVSNWSKHVLHTGWPSP